MPSCTYLQIEAESLSLVGKPKFLFDAQMLVTKGTIPFKFERNRPARFGVLDRYATDASSIRWFELHPAVIIFHVANGEQGMHDILGPVSGSCKWHSSQRAQSKPVIDTSSLFYSLGGGRQDPALRLRV